MTGHLLGAAGGIEAIFTALAVHHGVVPPTINLERPDDACAGIDLVPGEAREAPVRAAISNSFGFGGTNGTVLFTRVE
jgi:3-oxoacyl-[acyl-carrier-protein] synthase II